MKKFMFVLMALMIAGVFYACSEDDNPAGSEEEKAPVYVNEGPIGNNGGTVKIEDESNPLNGSYVKIPKGVMNFEENISIGITNESVFPDDTTAVVVKFGPEGMTFDEPVEIAVPFPEGSTPDNLNLYYFDADSGNVEQLSITEIDMENRLIKATTDHFSYYTASDNGIGANIENLDMNGKVGVRFNIPNIYIIRLWGIVRPYFSNYLENSYFDKVYVNYYVSLCKGFWGDDLERKEFGIVIDKNFYGLYSVAYYMNGAENPPVLVKHNIEFEDLQKWIDGSAIVTKFDTNISSGSDYYTKVKLQLRSGNGQTFFDNLTGIYKFSNREDRKEIGKMPDFNKDMNNNGIDDDFEKDYNTNNPPSLTITSPKNNSSVEQGESITISVNADDTDGISYVSFKAGTRIKADYKAPYELIVNTSSLSPGLNTIEVTATDKLGLKTNKTVKVNIATPQDTPPACTIISPKSGASYTVGTKLDIKVNAGDSETSVSMVKFYINGKETARDNNAPYLYSWNTASISAGSYAIKVRAVDTKGRYTDKVVNVKLNKPDNKFPECKITSPVDLASFEAGDGVSLQAQATDADGKISYVKFTVSKNGTQVYSGVDKTADSQNKFRVNWSTGNIDAGSYSLKATAYDNHNATKSDEIDITFKGGAAEKEIKVTSPASGTVWEAGKAHTIKWTDNFSENVRIELYSYHVGSSYTGYLLQDIITESTESDGSYIWESGANLAEGSRYKIRIYSVKTYGASDFSDDFTIKKGDTEVKPGEMVLVEAGTFQMGGKDGDSDEWPVHSVTISKDFYIGKYEVTQKEYEFIMGENPSQHYSVGYNYPVYYVSWQEAVKYCNKLSEKEGLDLCYTINGTNVSCDFTKNGYRLPTEAEWEFAARGGNKSEGYKYSGSNDPDAVAWYNANSDNKTHLVGGKLPNEVGAYDMSGNVWEWSWDWYDRYNDSPATDPTGPTTGTERSIRGGGIGLNSSHAHSTSRSYLEPNGAHPFTGFRIARSEDSGNSNTPPTASFNLSPSTGTTSTNFSFDASGCNDAEDSNSDLEVRWDFDGDDSWDTNYSTEKTATYKYSSTGSYTVKLEVKDSEGLTDTVEKSVSVTDGNIIPGEMVLVESGTFQMGDTFGDGYSNEKPVHSVTISKDFYIGKYEVTHAEYIDFLNAIGCDANGSYNGNELIDMSSSYCAVSHNGSFYFEGSSKADDENCPVIEVTWYGAVEYANFMSSSNGKEPCYAIDGTNISCDFTKNGYRLPTEAEWEFAARGGNKSEGYKYSGSDDPDAVAWYGSNSGFKTHPVGGKLPNEIGAYDMSGNVWEWCQDWYSSSYYSSSPDTDPTGPVSGSYRAGRGGSWDNGAGSIRSAHRYGNDPDYSSHVTGFRLLRTAE